MFPVWVVVGTVTAVVVGVVLLVTMVLAVLYRRRNSKRDYTGYETRPLRGGLEGRNQVLYGHWYFLWKKNCEESAFVPESGSLLRRCSDSDRQSSGACEEVWDVTLIPILQFLSQVSCCELFSSLSSVFQYHPLCRGQG